jgi:hypothetical protein
MPIYKIAPQRIKRHPFGSKPNVQSLHQGAPIYTLMPL